MGQLLPHKSSLPEHPQFTETPFPENDLLQQECSYADCLFKDILLALAIMMEIRNIPGQVIQMKGCRMEADTPLKVLCGGFVAE